MPLSPNAELMGAGQPRLSKNNGHLTRVRLNDLFNFSIVLLEVKSERAIGTFCTYDRRNSLRDKARCVF